MVDDNRCDCYSCSLRRAAGMGGNDMIHDDIDVAWEKSNAWWKGWFAASALWWGLGIISWLFVKL